MSTLIRKEVDLARTETMGSKPDPEFVAAVRKAVGN